MRRSDLERLARLVADHLGLDVAPGPDPKAERDRWKFQRDEVRRHLAAVTDAPVPKRRAGISGPYRHGRRWRIVIQNAGERTVRSFSSKWDAETFIDDAKHREPGSLCDGIENEVATALLGLKRHGHDGTFVYAIRPVSGGLTKIGVADDPVRRIRNLQSMAPVPMQLVDLVHGSRADEIAYHRQYHGLRAHGEWFALGDNRNPLGQCPLWRRP